MVQGFMNKLRLYEQLILKKDLKDKNTTVFL